MTTKRFILVLALVSLVTSLVLSSFASGNPDGLEKVAIDHGFASSAVSIWNGFIPEYYLSWIGNDMLASGLAGLIGTALVFGIVYGMMFVLVRVKK